MSEFEKISIKLGFLGETPRGFRTFRGKRTARRFFGEMIGSKLKLDLLAEVAAIAREEEEYKATLRKRNSPVTGEMVRRSARTDLMTNNEPCDQGSCDEGTLLTDKFEEIPPKECSQESTSSAVPVRSDGVDGKTSNASPKSAEICGDSRTEKPSLDDWIRTQIEVKPEKNTDSSGDDDDDNDDDDNSSGSTQPSTVTCKTPRSQYPADTTKSMMTEILSSRFRKAGPTFKRHNDGHSFISRKIRCNRQITRRSALQESGSPVPEAVVGVTKPLVEETTTNVDEENRTWPELPAKSFPYALNERIRSIVVPEITVENPETATVGELRGRVCGALSNMFSGGFKVGVVHRGERLSDDGQTLREAGVSNGDGELRFILEPRPRQVQQPSCCVNPSNLESPRPLARIPPSCESTLNGGGASCSPLAMVVDPSSPKRTTPNALVAGTSSLSPSRACSGAMVPFQRRKSNSSGERRARRPFTVAEVVALVETVEELGTGRWRDVKNRAFAHSEHRTYVDLKDKWKTLVHTAELGAQQRRGEPVPQDLLDRVMATQTYWANHQTRLRTDHPTQRVVSDHQMRID